MDLIRIDLRDRPIRSRRRRRRAAGAGNESAASNERSALVSACIVVACLASGAGLAWYGDFRVPKQSILDVFNEAVSRWNQNLAAQFNDTEWRLAINGTILPLVKSERFFQGIDKGEPAHSLEFGMQGLNGHVFSSLLPDSDDCTEEKAKATHGNLSNPACLASRMPVSPKQSQKAQNSYLQPVRLELLTGESIISLGNVSFFSRVYKKSQNWKSCVFRDSGRWLNGVCEVYSFVDTICVKVTQAQGKWTLDDTYGNFGCDPHHHWDVLHWKKLKLSKGNSSTPIYLPPGISTKPALFVRSTFDPEIISKNLTERMVEEVEPKVEQWAAGIILLSVGFLALIPTLVVGWPVLSKRIRLKGQQHYSKHFPNEDQRQ